MLAALEDAARGAAARPVPCASLVPANETCTCAAPMGSSSSLPADERWGLPSDGCPAAPYLVDEYPKRHAALIAEGRILIHCARSNNFGNYLQSVPSAVLMSVLTDRALILECDVEGAAINVTLTSQKLHRYFRGPHFSWRLPQHRAATRAGPRDPGACDRRWRYARELDNSCLPSNDALKTVHLESGGARELLFGAGTAGGVRVTSEANTYTDKLLANPELRASAVMILGGKLVSHRNLDGCLLRYVLRPSARLEELLRATMNTPRVSSTTGLLLNVGAHVRREDNAGGAAPLGWKYASWKYHSVFDLAGPRVALRCVAHASRAPEGEASRCLGCSVASSSAEVEQCAVAALPGALRTAGSPAMLGLGRSAADEDRVFVDWWVLARSAVLVLFGFSLDGQSSHYHFSTFAKSALIFRDASSRRGTVLRLTPRKNWMAADVVQRHCHPTSSYNQTLRYEDFQPKG